MTRGLLAAILDAHGGLTRFRRYAKVDPTIISNGGFFSLKGRLQDKSSPPNDRVAARGTFIGDSLRRCRSAYDGHG